MINYRVDPIIIVDPKNERIKLYMCDFAVTCPFGVQASGAFIYCYEWMLAT